jgi:hypothetical protein
MLVSQFLVICLYTVSAAPYDKHVQLLYVQLTVGIGLCLRREEEPLEPEGEKIGNNAHTVE